MKYFIYNILTDMFRLVLWPSSGRCSYYKDTKLVIIASHLRRSEYRSKHVVQNIVNKIHRKYWSSFVGYWHISYLINTRKIERNNVLRLSLVLDLKIHSLVLSFCWSYLLLSSFISLLSVTSIGWHWNEKCCNLTTETWRKLCVVTVIIDCNAERIDYMDQSPFWVSNRS